MVGYSDAMKMYSKWVWIGDRSVLLLCEKAADYWAFYVYSYITRIKMELCVSKMYIQSIVFDITSFFVMLDWQEIRINRPAIPRYLHVHSSKCGDRAHTHWKAAVAICIHKPLNTARAHKWTDKTLNNEHFSKEKKAMMFHWTIYYGSWTTRCINMRMGELTICVAFSKSTLFEIYVCCVLFSMLLCGHLLLSFAFAGCVPRSEHSYILF